MESVTTQLVICGLNLAVGVGLGWLWGGLRDRRRLRAAVSQPEREIDEVLVELNDTIEQQCGAWSSLREQLTDNPTLSRNELDVHVSSNRYYSRFLESCMERLERSDPHGRHVPQDLSDRLTASRDDADAFADDLERTGYRTSDPAIQELLTLLRAMERSNRALRADLQFTREQFLEQTQRLRRAENAALEDPLTGLPNRRAFEQRLRELESRYDRHQRPFALLLIDLDHFKHLNDTYGHDAGDATLQVAARVLREACRTGDQLSRYGGEEFAVLAAEADAHSALRLAERLRARVDQAVVRHGDAGIRVTCSIGIAHMKPERRRRELIAAADAALYDAKNAGRNAIRAEAPPPLLRTESDGDWVPASSAATAAEAVVAPTVQGA